MTVIVDNQNDLVIIADNSNDYVVAISGTVIINSNGTGGITGFTNGNGFTGNVTNNSLSLILQNANATQSGQVTSSDWNTFNNKGTSNLTVGNTSIHAFAGDLGYGALGNISTLQGQTSNLTSSINATNNALSNHTANVSNPHNVTKSQIGLSNVSDIAPLDLPISNATQTALNGKLNSVDYVQHFKGLYATLGALQTAYPTATSGDYAQVDVGIGSNPVTYVWDVSDSQWVIIASGGSGAANTDQLPEGSTNLYFTNNRSVSALSSTLSNYVPTNRTVNGVNLTANVTLTTANISDSADKRYITDAKSTVLNQTSGTNTGDQDLSGLVPKTTTINGKTKPSVVLTANKIGLE